MQNNANFAIPEFPDGRSELSDELIPDIAPMMAMTGKMVLMIEAP